MDVGILSQTKDFTYDDLLLMIKMLRSYNNTLTLFLDVFESEERFLKFLDLFAGKEFTLPNRSRVFHVILNIQVYRYFQQHKDEPNALQLTAKRFDMTTQRVTDIIERVKSKL